ncbi:cadherin-related family member 3-like [Callorhinchus milii]|uniref:cadherin-related family member 3-like n=1 Tax=Callorhinchus milii TaxID=7868 RepID=UPI001C3FD5FA|nr:cadherin-related family member 3-like [Callorhinchus milii]
MKSLAPFFKPFLLVHLLGLTPAGVEGALALAGLPATITVQEHIPAGTSIFNCYVVSTLGGTTLSPRILSPQPLNDFFSVSVVSGLNLTVIVLASAGLDYETQRQFELSIFVEDNKGYTDLKVLTVILSDVNEPPRFLDGLTVQVNILENSEAGTVIYEVQATDPDRDETLSFAVNSTLFAAHSSGQSGIIVAAQTLDYETDPHSFAVAVTVMDTDGHLITGILLVNILNLNDNSPRFTKLATLIEIFEDVTPGTVITTVTAEDLDDNTLSYHLKTHNPYFTINSATGEIQVAQTLDTGSTSLKNATRQQLQIVVTDSLRGGHTSSDTITILIKDINNKHPFCSPHTHSNSHLNYILRPFAGAGRRFALNPRDPRTIVVTGILDFEDPTNFDGENVFEMLVIVNDSVAPYHQDTVTVYVTILPVNEFTPNFTQMSYTFNVSEITTSGTVIGRVSAEDRDRPAAALTYSLVGGGSTQGYWQLFRISPSSGNLQLVAKPDYETKRNYVLTVLAVDGGPEKGQTGTTTITVNILPVNDEPPVCHPGFQQLTVSAGTAVGTKIAGFRLSCTDADSAPQAFRYFIISGNRNNHFKLSPSAGSNLTQLVLAIAFQYFRESAGWEGRQEACANRDSDHKRQSYRPTTTTQETSTTDSITYVWISQNTYEEDAWYIPFLVTVGCLLLLGWLGLLTFRLVKYIRSLPKELEKETLVERQEQKKRQQDVVVEMTKFTTIFDGEALDPVTGKMYQYNTISGARRWKDVQSPGTDGEDMTATVPGPLTSDRRERDEPFTSDSRVKDTQPVQNATRNTPKRPPAPKPSNHLRNLSGVNLVETE